MLDTKGLKSVIEFLKSQDKFLIARDILDVYYSKAQTIDDFNAIGEASIASQYHELRLKCAEVLYTRVFKTELLFKCRENLYKAYHELNQPEKSLFYINLNLKQKPNDPDTLMYKSFSLALLGKRDESEEILNNILDKNEEFKKYTNYTLSSKLLREGKTSEGIIGFVDQFKKKNPLFEDQLKLTKWSGGVYPKRTIIVNAEGGIGDEFINIRFLKNLKSLGMKPILYSSWHTNRPDIVSLFRRNGIEITTNHLFFDKKSLWTHMMSLPGYLGLTEKELWTGPYIKPLRQEKNRLNDTNFKIGIKCNGNPFFGNDICRTIPIEEMLSVMPDSSSVYYLDIDKEHPNTISLKGRIENWEDTLDFIDQMDVVVSSCTSIVHAAGAMGKRTIVLVPIAKYYIWTSTRTDESSPWYGDHLKVIEQMKPRSWKEPLERVQQLLLEYKG